MRIVALLLFIIPITLSAQKTGILPYQGYKVVYMDTVPLKNGNFQMTAKVGLNKYVSVYNSTIFQQVNKIGDVISYEDSAMVVANVRFNVSQMFANSLTDGTVTVTRQGDRAIVTLTDLVITKSADVVAGAQAGNNPVENIDNAKFKGYLRKLHSQIRILFQSFR
jgi:hypothetical protein